MSLCPMLFQIRNVKQNQMCTQLTKFISSNKKFLLSSKRQKEIFFPVLVKKKSCMLTVTATQHVPNNITPLQSSHSMHVPLRNDTKPQTLSTK